MPDDRGQDAGDLLRRDSAAPEQGRREEAGEDIPRALRVLAGVRRLGLRDHLAPPAPVGGFGGDDDDLPHRLGAERRRERRHQRDLQDPQLHGIQGHGGGGGAGRHEGRVSGVARAGLAPAAGRCRACGVPGSCPGPARTTPAEPHSATPDAAAPPDLQELCPRPQRHNEGEPAPRHRRLGIRGPSPPESPSSCPGRPHNSGRCAPRATRMPRRRRFRRSCARRNRSHAAWQGHCRGRTRRVASRA